MPSSAFWPTLLSAIVVLAALCGADPGDVRFVEIVKNGYVNFREVEVISGGVNVVATLPFPPEAELQKDVALPSASYPSDHLALVVDLVVDDM